MEGRCAVQPGCRKTLAAGLGLVLMAQSRCSVGSPGALAAAPQCEPRGPGSSQPQPQPPSTRAGLLAPDPPPRAAPGALCCCPWPTSVGPQGADRSPRGPHRGLHFSSAACLLTVLSLVCHVEALSSGSSGPKVWAEVLECRCCLLRSRDRCYFCAWPVTDKATPWPSSKGQHLTHQTVTPELPTLSRVPLS